MRPRLLVVSTVHPADDPRIRHKLIGSLQDEWEITFAGQGRGPVDQRGIEWRELAGNRLIRWLRALGMLVRGRYEVASLHDPELLPAGILASFRRRIVFDVHENVPAQLRTKDWVPRILRPPLAALAGWLLRVAERRMAVTLAESGYSTLFRDLHPVFPNYLVGDPPPPRSADPDVGVVYLGDVTEARGLAMVVEAAGRAGAGTFSVMGRCSPDFRAHLLSIAASHSLELEFYGFVTPDRALRIAAGATLAVSPLLDTPNYRESLPTKVLEYLAVGVPTLASDLAGTRAAVAGKPGVLLLPPGDVDAWTAAIVGSLADLDLRAAACDGVAAIRAGYLWPEQEVRDFYSGLLESRR